MSLPAREPWTEEQANAVWDILVEHVGAGELERRNFVYHHTRESPPMEWRFCGTLGFGGKLRRNNGRVYVDCYPEDLTAKREAKLRRVNAELVALGASQGG